MRWLIGLIQVVGPILGSWHFLKEVWRPWKAFQGGEIESSWGGFFGPLIVNLLASGMWVSLIFLAPRWRGILEWIRKRLPTGSDEIEVSKLIKLIKRAFQEKRENGTIEARNLAARLNGVGEKESTSTASIEALRTELERILGELRGGVSG